MNIYLRSFYFAGKLKRFTIYTMIDVIQVELFYVLQVIFTIRAFRKRQKIKKTFDYLSMKNRTERKFLIYFFILLVVRILKFSLTETIASFIYMTKMMFAEMTVASSDFLFQFYVSMLIVNLKKIKEKLVKAKTKQKIDEIKQEVSQHFILKRKIEKHFSFELFLSIIYNYVQLVICLYWTFMRVKFKRLSRLNGK